MNSGGFGPIRTSLIPKLNNPSKIATAFCSNHERTILNGKSLISHSNASARALAIFIVEPELLH